MRTRLTNLMPPGSYLRNVSILTGGTIFAQGLMVLALPILTRLYTPEQFNLLAVYVALLGILGSVSCLRYNIAIPLPEDDANGIALVAVAILAALSISGLCAVPVIFAPEATATLLAQPGLQPYLWMVPIGVFIASVYDALQYWASRKRRFGLVTRTRMTRAVGGASTQLSIGAFSPSPFGLIFGHMIYGGLGLLGLARNMLKQDRAALRNLNTRRIVAEARRYRRFPLYSMPEALLNTAGIQMPIILIAAMAGGADAAFIMLAMTVLGAPMAFVGGSVAQVYLAESPARLRNGTLSSFTLNTMWTLAKTGGPLLFVVGAVSPFAFAAIFGREWEQAGWLVLWMTPWFILQFVASPVSMVLHVLERQDIALVLQAGGCVLRLVVVLVVGEVAPDYMSEAYAISGAVFYFAYVATISLVIPKHP